MHSYTFKIDELEGLIAVAKARGAKYFTTYRPDSDEEGEMPIDGGYSVTISGPFANEIAQEMRISGINASQEKITPNLHGQIESMLDILLDKPKDKDSENDHWYNVFSAFGGTLDDWREMSDWSAVQRQAEEDGFDLVAAVASKRRLALIAKIAARATSPGGELADEVSS